MSVERDFIKQVIDFPQSMKKSTFTSPSEVSLSILRSHKSQVADFLQSGGLFTSSSLVSVRSVIS